MAVVSVEELTKEYGDVRANDRVSFSVTEGEVFGYLGPNGAGKSTTIRTLMGFQSPTSGTATVLGADVREESALVERRERIGYVAANPPFDGTATGREILDLHAAIKGDDRREELLDRFDVPLDRRVRSYSTGQRQKLGLVQAFLHDPELLILDEPTAGLDPLMQRRFEALVREERAAGKSVLVSSHVLGEVRRLCDRVGIVRDGRMVTVESVSELLGRSGKTVRLLVDGRPDRETFDLAGVHDLTVERLATAAGDDQTTTADETTATGTTEREQTTTEREQTATEVRFTYTGDVNTLIDRLDDLVLVELDVEEAPLDEVFARFYGDGAT
jgi:ABC-2 type transport system ATP-binding protein